MKKAISKRIMAAVLSSAILISSLSLSAFAGDTLPYLGESAKGDNQPYQHGYRAEDLLSWSSESDPYASLLKAEVPLQTRNAAFSATQADPDLDDNVEYLTLAGDYGNAFFDSYSYTNEFSQYVFNYWQYINYYGSWHGMPTEEVPESLYNSDGERAGTSDWQQRCFEFGMMNLPNAGYTNAAHKNGVLSLGCIFQPRAYQHYDILLEKDENGNFPYAEKLIEMCQYYGFDGWFFNMEGRSISSENKALLEEFFSVMRNAGLYIQWYTASSSFSGSTAAYLTSATTDNTENATDRANSVFLDYAWDTTSLLNSAGTVESYGLNIFKALFGGIEAGGYRWTNNYDKFLSSGKMVASIASLGTDFVHHGLDEDLGTGTNMLREQNEYQWMAFERERMWWTGPTEDPTVENTDGVSRSDIGVSSTSFKGVAQYITEKSVINGDTFVTNFNTGHGLEYAVNGTVSNTHEWSNINIQDILPTWQWWFETSGTKLQADFDYGTEYQKNLKDKTESSFDFDLVGAYNGGSSLAVYGKVDSENFMHLYKTALDVKANSKMDVTFKKTSDDTATMQLGLIFKDDPDTVVKVDLDNTAAKSDGWVTSSADLSAYAGKTIEAFGLVFSGTADNYQMNIGQMKYTSGDAQKPDTPTGLTIDKAYDTGEMVISWNKADYDQVKQYNVYAVEDGKEIYLGGIYDETYYIKDIYDTENEVTIELKAVSADGTESDPATVTYDYSKAVKEVAVTAEDGKLNVTWTGGQADVSVKKDYSTETAIYTASGNGSAAVTVPTGADADGARYTMAITSADGVVTTYDGKMDDSYSTPYDGGLTNLKFSNPTSKDWYKLHYWVTTTDGEQDEQTYTRGTGNGTTNDWADFSALPSNTTKVKIVLEDYSGNMSNPTEYSIISVSVTPSSPSVQASATQQFTAEVTNYLTDNTVTWTVEGAASANTAITSEGLLTVGLDESASSITVRATSNEDSKTSGTVSVSITAAIALNPSSGNVYKGDTQQFTVQKLGEDMLASDYTWSATAAYSWDSMSENTTISEDGLLTVAADESCYCIKVTATNKENTDLVYTAQVAPQNSLAITRVTTGTIYKGQDVTYGVKYKGETADAEDYNWTVEGITGNTTITDGVLSIDTNESASSLKITATKKDNSNVTTYTTLSSYYINDPVAISPSSVKVAQGKSVTFSAKIKGADADSSQIIWSVEGAEKATEISEDGVLTVAEDETAESVTVKATSKEDSQLSAAATVTISVKPQGCVSIDATILGSSGYGNTGETQDNALDGDESTKWCTTGETGWLAIDLGQEYTINRWRTVHGQKGDGEPGFNTEKFALEVLKDSNATAEQLASSSYLSDSSNWTEVQYVDNSTDQAMVVDKTFDTPVTGRYFRLRIDDSCINQWTAVRIHEFQLYEGSTSPITSITLSDESITLKKGETTVLTATVSPENTTDDKTITWESSDTNVATVDENGNVKAIGKGEAAITATSATRSDVKAACAITVLDEVVPITSITLSDEAITLKKGETMALTATVSPENTTDDKTITWESSDTNVAMVDENGNVEAIGKGEATITAVSAARSDVKATCTVTVPDELANCVSIDATILGASDNGQGSETADKALDGDESTKWCSDGSETGWLAIDLGQEYTITRWRTVHGEKGDGEPGFNTEKFALEVLKDPNATAEQLASSSYLSDSSNWTEVQYVDNSTDQAMVVDKTLDTPVTGRYFRLRIDDSCINQWTAVRIHEFQLFVSDEEPEPEPQPETESEPEPEPEKFDQSDEDSNVRVKADSKVLPEGAKLAIQELTDSSDYNFIQTAISDVGEKFIAYDISIMSRNTTIQPNGKVTVWLPIPSGYDRSQLAVYRIEKDGTLTKMEGKARFRYYVFESDHFSIYALVETASFSSEKTSSTAPSSSFEAAPETASSEAVPIPDTGDTTSPIMAIGSIIVLILSGLYMTVKNRKPDKQ